MEIRQHPRGLSHAHGRTRAGGRPREPRVYGGASKMGRSSSPTRWSASMMCGRVDARLRAPLARASRPRPASSPAARSFSAGDWEFDVVIVGGGVVACSPTLADLADEPALRAGGSPLVEARRPRLPGAENATVLSEAPARARPGAAPARVRAVAVERRDAAPRRGVGADFERGRRAALRPDARDGPRAGEGALGGHICFDAGEHGFAELGFVAEDVAIHASLLERLDDLHASARLELCCPAQLERVQFCPPGAAGAPPTRRRLRCARPTRRPARARTACGRASSWPPTARSRACARAQRARVVGLGLRAAGHRLDGARREHRRGVATIPRERAARAAAAVGRLLLHRVVDLARPRGRSSRPFRTPTSSSSSTSRSRRARRGPSRSRRSRSRSRRRPSNRRRRFARSSRRASRSTSSSNRRACTPTPGLRSLETRPTRSTRWPVKASTSASPTWRRWCARSSTEPRCGADGTRWEDARARARVVSLSSLDPAPPRRPASTWETATCSCSTIARDAPRTWR